MDYMNELDKKNSEIEASEYIDDTIVTFKLLGLKKFGSSMLWIKQTLYIGETFERDAGADIKEISKKIAGLNPYFVENYYASALVLGLIKKYNDYEGAFEILRLGMKYNPENIYLKNYYGGIGASLRGEDRNALLYFEKMVEETKDPILVNVIVNLYKKRWEAEREYKDYYKLYNYTVMLYESGVEKYRKRAEEILNKLEEIEKGGGR
jgi:tetratricopeptide (TPR) repeat protein